MITHIITYLMRCRRCLCEWRASWPEQRCPRCNGADVRVEREG
jgi:Zn finger protein HypA/HybF involved in hydrogenase expression